MTPESRAGLRFPSEIAPPLGRPACMCIMI